MLEAAVVDHISSESTRLAWNMDTVNPTALVVLVISTHTHPFMHREAKCHKRCHHAAQQRSLKTCTLDSQIV